MAIQPTFLEIALPDEERCLVIGIGIFWGGDATKLLPLGAESRFRTTVVERVEYALLGDPALLQSIVANGEPAGMEIRYRGGDSADALNKLLEQALDEAKVEMPEISHRCPGAVLMRS